MKVSSPLKIVYILFLFICLVGFNAQKPTIHEIDSLQTVYSQKLQQNGKFPELIAIHKIALKKSTDINYVKGELKGYIELANFLCGMNRNQESLHYLKLAEEKLNHFNHPIFSTRLKIIYGRNYQALGLYNQAIESFNQAIKRSYKIPSKEDRDERLFFIYDWKRFTFTKMNIPDSVRSMENKCLAMPNRGFIIYLVLADKCIVRKQLDSAEYFLTKSIATIKVDNFEASSMIMLSFGKLYIAKKEYDKALEFLIKSESITEKAKLKGRNLEVYQAIATVYNKLNDKSKENEYLLKYFRLNDSLNQAEKKALNISVERIFKEQKEEEDANKKQLYLIILSTILGGSVIVIIIMRLYNSKEKKRNILIDQKNIETHNLRKKLDNSFEELIQLAIHDDPLFIPKFKEIYFEFYTILISGYPQLTASDIKFCAFIKLNFSNKEIAEYGHMSIRTVESKKYRIRKKIELDQEIDFNNWILNL